MDSALPGEIRIAVLNGKTRLPVSDLAVKIRLQMNRKNDYHVGPKLTDDLGEVVFSPADIQAAIESAQKESLMDYAGIEWYSGRITVRILSPSELHQTIEVLRLWRAPESTVSPLMGAKNEAFESMSYDYPAPAGTQISVVLTV